MGDVLHIGLDFDDTLLPMHERVAELLSAQFGEPMGPTDDDGFRVSRRWGLSAEEFQVWFAEHLPELHEIEPFPDVCQTLRAWSEFATLRIITARQPHMIGHAARWVRRHGLPIEQIHSAPSAGEKALCALANSVSWFVDDYHEHARAMADLDINVILLDRPYNTACAHGRIHHARDWQGVAAAMDRHRQGLG